MFKVQFLRKSCFEELLLCNIKDNSITVARLAPRFIAQVYSVQVYWHTEHLYRRITVPSIECATSLDKIAVAGSILPKSKKKLVDW